LHCPDVSEYLVVTSDTLDDDKNHDHDEIVQKKISELSVKLEEFRKEHQESQVDIADLSNSILQITLKLDKIDRRISSRPYN
jgi:hypothetical protein